MTRKRMQWNRLLSTKRVTDFEGCKIQRSDSQYPDPRSVFEKDFDQIIFSYPFRRLQDKTQVIPFPKYDFVHTRLTHSLEVASIGRSLGKMAAELFLHELDNNDFTSSDIGALVAAACLAHDIGNPPFGHSGEDAISHYFSYTSDDLTPESYEGEFNYKTLQSFYSRNEPYGFFSNSEVLNQFRKWTDLCQFEGNANGFRILTKNCEKGINPSLALLGTFTKYPRESFLKVNSSEGGKSQSKYGFFQEQKKLFQWMADELGLLEVKDLDENDCAYYRHPLAFLMEAADDIAYRIIDFEDGLSFGLIDFEKIYREITIRGKSNNHISKRFINKSPQDLLNCIAEIDQSFNQTTYESIKSVKGKISYLRSKVINVLVHECFSVFEKNYEKIMRGEFDSALLDEIDNKDIIDCLDNIDLLVRKYVYNHRAVLECEASGFEVMEHLIKSFSVGSNICISCDDTVTKKDEKFMSLLPEELWPENEKNPEELTYDEKYHRMLNVLGYISGMTDNYATRTYRNIAGISVWR